jgi:hypothetical protein
MKKSAGRFAGAASIAIAALLSTTTSRAEDAASTPPPAAQDATVTHPSAAEDTTATPPSAGAAQAQGSTQGVAVEQTTYARPNRFIIAAGILGFVGAYVPSFIVAAHNGNSHDNNLYIPVVGPWLDLEQRPGCGLGPTSCGRESGFAALLIVDGIFQALGPVATVLGFLVPERHTVIITAKADKPARPTVHVVPARVGRDAYGVSAFGDF